LFGTGVGKVADHRYFLLFFDNSDVNAIVSFFNQMLSMFVSIILWPSY